MSDLPNTTPAEPAEASEATATEPTPDTAGSATESTAPALRIFLFNDDDAGACTGDACVLPMKDD